MCEELREPVRLSGVIFPQQTFHAPWIYNDKHTRTDLLVNAISSQVFIETNWTDKWLWHEWLLRFPNTQQITVK